MEIGHENRPTKFGRKRKGKLRKRKMEIFHFFIVFPHFFASKLACFGPKAASKTSPKAAHD